MNGRVAKRLRKAAIQLWLMQDRAGRDKYGSWKHINRMFKKAYTRKIGWFGVRPQPSREIVMRYDDGGAS